MRRWIGLALVAAALLAGCGGDDGGDTKAAATTTATATSTTPALTTTTGKPSRRDRISTCLTGLGYRLTGGLTQAGTDPDGADYQIVLQGRHGGGYIGFYKNASRAERVVKKLSANAAQVNGAAAERHGSINIVWVDLDDKAARASVRDCLVD